MKLKFTIIAFMMACGSAFAQNAMEPMPKIVIPENYNSPEFKKKLVDEALKNTNTTKIANFETGISQNELASSKAKWLDYITVTGNLNEFTLNPDRFNTTDPVTGQQLQNPNLFFPRYNFSLSFGLGSLFSNANNVKIARKQVAISQLRSRDTQIDLRSLVLAKFEDYILNREQLKLQLIIVTDDEALFKQTERKFRGNEISISEFNEVSKSYYSGRIAKIEAQRNLAVTKYELEKLIGAQLEDSL